MDGPYDRLSAAGKVIEQDPVVEEVPVDIVDVYHIRIYPLHVLYELPGSPVRCQPVPVRKPCNQPVPGYAHPVAHRHRNGSRLHIPVPAPAVSHIAFPAVRHGEIPDLLHYPSGGSGFSQDGVYL